MRRRLHPPGRLVLRAIEDFLTLLLAVSALSLGIGTLRKGAYMDRSRSSHSPVVEHLTGHPAPRFSVQTVRGDTVTVPPSGSLSMLVFFRTDCIFCQASVHSYEALLRDRCDVTMAVVSREPIEVLQRFWRRAGWLDSELCTNFILGRILDSGEVEAYRVSGTPTHFFVDSTGLVLGAQLGMLRPPAYPAYEGIF